MADSKESFEILENGSGDGVSPTASQIGEASGGKIGMTVFPFRDASGNLRMPEVNASNILKTDGSGVTQPVSGTVTANAGTNLNTSALALETTQAAGNVLVGAVTETAPGTDTASSGLNGRLQRIAQRLTSILTALSDRTQKTQITNGANDAAVLNTAPSQSQYGLVVRQVPFELPTFSVVAENITVGNNKSMIALQNTGTSVVVLREIWIINDQTTAVTGVAGEFRVHRIASFTGGTALSPSTFDTADSLPAGITTATGATIATETTLLRTGKWSTDEWGPGTLDVEASDHGFQNTEPFWSQTPNGKGLVVRQNQGIHVRFATNSTAGAFNLRFIFTTET